MVGDDKDASATAPIALVTGGYKGIGLAIVRSLASQGVTTIFTSRNESQGKQVVNALENEYQLKTIIHHCLDVLDLDSIGKLVEWVKQHFGSIDILINNAAVFGPQLSGDQLPDFQRAKKVVETNYYGSKRMVEAFLPLLKPGARIVNVSSAASRLDSLQGQAAVWKTKLLDTDNLSEETIDSFIHSFYEAAGQGAETLKEQGWPTMNLPIPGYPIDDVADYCVSKMALNAYTWILAKRHPDLLVNAMCPGLCNTDMSLHNGHSADQGADTAVWLALEWHPRTSGKFFVKRKEVADLERIPVSCNEELAETPESVGRLMFPLYLERAKSLGLL